MIKLDKLSIPPTSNKLYSSFRGRLIKSKDGREYDQKIDTYAFLHKRKIEAAKQQVNDLLAESSHLKIETTFIFHFKRIISVKGDIKKLDTSNRVKQLHDSIARLLEIDDKHFSISIVNKAICQDIKHEQVLVTISKGELIRFEDL